MRAQQALRSNDTYVAGLVALATRADLEFDGLAFLKRPSVVSALDIGVVDEEVIAVFSGDEAEALDGVEEFHSSFCQRSSFLASPEPKTSSPTKPRRDTQPGTQPVGDSSPPDSARSPVNMRSLVHFSGSAYVPIWAGVPLVRVRAGGEAPGEVLAW